MKKHIALGLVASTLFLAGCCTSHHQTKLEYQQVNSLSEVNELAKTGWSVVSVMHASGASDSYLMKHRIQ
jgi:protein involved in sex pheromone biosynthesis